MPATNYFENLDEVLTDDRERWLGAVAGEDRTLAHLASTQSARQRLLDQNNRRTATRGAREDGTGYRSALQDIYNSRRRLSNSRSIARGIRANARTNLNQSRLALANYLEAMTAAVPLHQQQMDALIAQSAGLGGGGGGSGRGYSSRGGYGGSGSGSGSSTASLAAQQAAAEKRYAPKEFSSIEELARFNQDIANISGIDMVRLRNNPESWETFVSVQDKVHEFLSDPTQTLTLYEALGAAQEALQTENPNADPNVLGAAMIYATNFYTNLNTNPGNVADLLSQAERNPNNGLFQVIKVQDASPFSIRGQGIEETERLRNRFGSNLTGNTVQGIWEATQEAAERARLDGIYTPLRYFSEAALGSNINERQRFNRLRYPSSYEDDGRPTANYLVDRATEANTEDNESNRFNSLLQETLRQRTSAEDYGMTANPNSIGGGGPGGTSIVERPEQPQSNWFPEDYGFTADPNSIGGNGPGGTSIVEEPQVDAVADSFQRNEEQRMMIIQAILAERERQRIAAAQAAAAQAAAQQSRVDMAGGMGSAAGFIPGLNLVPPVTQGFQLAPITNTGSGGVNNRYF